MHSRGRTNILQHLCYPVQPCTEAATGFHCSGTDNPDHNANTNSDNTHAGSSSDNANCNDAGSSSDNANCNNTGSSSDNTNHDPNTGSRTHDTDYNTNP